MKKVRVTSPIEKPRDGQYRGEAARWCVDGREVVVLAGNIDSLRHVAAKWNLETPTQGAPAVLTKTIEEL